MLTEEKKIIIIFIQYMSTLILSTDTKTIGFFGYILGNFPDVLGVCIKNKAVE